MPNSLGAFFLLNSLRSDPYKASSPEAALDLEEISTHAAQSVALSLFFATSAIIIFLFQGLLIISSPLTGLAISFFLNFIAGLMIAYELVYLRWSLARRFLRRSYRSGFRIGFLNGLTEFFKSRTFQAEPNQNVIIFGGFKPFLGAGTELGSYSVAIDRIPKQSESESFDKSDRIDIPVYEFYKSIDEEIKKLKLPNIEIVSRLHVDGFELDNTSPFLESYLSKPKVVILEDQIWTLGQVDLESNRRAYRVFRYIDKSRDNVFSYFLRFYNIGSVTFVEVSSYALQSFDRSRFTLKPLLEDNQLTRILKTIGAGILLATFSLYIIPAVWQVWVFLRNIYSWWRYDSRQKRAARLQEEYNYGLVRTFRESIAAPLDQSYFANQDMIMYLKAFQEGTLKGIVSLLRRYGVDTSEFEKTATNINNGVIMSGGNLSANQVAVGQGAKAEDNTFSKTVSKVGQKIVSPGSSTNQSN